MREKYRVAISKCIKKVAKSIKNVDVIEYKTSSKNYKNHEVF